MMPLRSTVLPWLFGALCLALSATASAADCTAVLSDSNVDFGQMRPDASKHAKHIRPSPVQRIYTALCKAPAQMNLVFRTPAAGTNGTGEARDALKFGDRGTYRVRVLNARLDGAPVQLARLPAIGQPPGEAPTSELTLKPSDILAPVQGQQLLRGERLDVTLQISARIPVDAMSVIQTVTFDAVGQLSLDVR
ncbi:hypothetical protein PI87_17010 [Ralstonia sp. A12]|uniref:hypothetical protein n=1 Tax=Ralstonia sp. A12 TaxID=1217052 RepID=UPI0005758CE1|nr:hypothetical protein [Ralstonia sp. A12]KHK53543.1 hypothetical protein PI87_17010 [Ralstonia sp. A12]